MNRASRAFTLKHYHMLWEWVDWSFYPFSEGVEHIFFNPAKDILTLNFNTLIRSDFPEYTNAHARVIFLLHNNPKRQIIDQVEVSLSRSFVSRSLIQTTFENQICS